MDQLAIDFTPLARRSDPLTSHRAASRARAFAPSHRNRVAAALRDGPATAHELAERTGLLAHQVLKRLPELQALGLAEPTGAERGGAREWRVIL
jgi:predicted Rossmann fold nucleotide-binding protein DprA/Smf involved in DNA uptake